MNLSPSVCAVFVCLWLIIPRAAAQDKLHTDVAPPAKSDTYGETEDGKKVRLQHREVGSANFRIAGVDLTSDREVLEQAAKIFGNSPMESHGDGADGERTTCYRSAMDGDDTHLIFARGEVDSEFLLASDGEARNPGNICPLSAKITRLLATDSGLRLGLTKQQVIAIIGSATEKSKNTTRRTETLIYSLEARKKTDPQKLAKWWQEEKGAYRPDFLANYGSYDLEVSISAEFLDNSLTRLSVDWSAQY